MQLPNCLVGPNWCVELNCGRINLAVRIFYGSPKLPKMMFLSASCHKLCLNAILFF